MDNENLTPEEIEQLEKEAQQQTGPTFYDRVNATRDIYTGVDSIKNRIEQSKTKNTIPKNVENEVLKEASSNLSKEAVKKEVTKKVVSEGAKAAGSSVAKKASLKAILAYLGPFLPVIGIVILIISAVILLSVLKHSIVAPLSEKYSVDAEDLVNEYDSMITDEEAESDANAGGIRDITQTDDEDLDKLFKDVKKNKLTLFEKISSGIFKWLGISLIPESKMSAAYAGRIIEIKKDEKLSQMGTNDQEQLPLGALLTTFTYDYSSQYVVSENENVEFDENTVDSEGNLISGTTNRVNPTTPLDMIASLFREEILKLKNPDDVKDMLDHMVFHTYYPTFTFTEVGRENIYSQVIPDKLIKVIIYMGCKQSNTDSYNLDYEKFYKFLRYGAYVSGYAVDQKTNDYKVKGNGDPYYLWGKEDVINYNPTSNDTTAFGEEYFQNTKSSYTTSHEQCELMQKAIEAVAALNGGVAYNIDTNSDLKVLSFSYNEIYKDEQDYIIENDNQKQFIAFNYESKIKNILKENIRINSDNSGILAEGSYYNACPLRGPCGWYDSEGNYYGNGEKPDPNYKGDPDSDSGGSCPGGVCPTQTCSTCVKPQEFNAAGFAQGVESSVDDGVIIEYKLDRDSVTYATDFFKKRDITDGDDTINTGHELFASFSKYDVKADFESDEFDNATVKVDNSEPNGDGSFNVNYGKGDTYTYEHGFIYNRYPFYMDEFQREEGKVHEFDKVKTPKSIERQIDYIDVYKDLYNEIMGYSGFVLPGGLASGDYAEYYQYLIDIGVIGKVTGSAAKEAVAKALFKYFGKPAAAGLMANIEHESGFNPTALGDSGTSFGLFQWHNGRFTALVNMFPDSYWTIESQIEYLMYELRTGYKKVYDVLMDNSKSAYDKALYFCLYFERPANKETKCPIRAAKAVGYYDYLGGINGR